jgi:hypothetical protein
MKDHPSILEYLWQNKFLREEVGVEVVGVAGVAGVAGVEGVLVDHRLK